ncbi:MAG: histidine kinase [Cyclobacteriaceae bacterium]
MIKYSFCLLILFTCSVVNGQGQTNYTIDDGLPSNTVYRIYQSKQGYLWLCTDRGLSRYDGRSFVNVSAARGLPDDEIFDLFEDTSGRLWLYTLNGSIGFISNQVQFQSTISLIPSDTRSRITGIQESNDSLFIAFLEGRILTIVDEEVVEVDSVPGQRLHGMFMHENQRLAQVDNMMYYFRNDSMTSIESLGHSFFSLMKPISTTFGVWLLGISNRKIDLFTPFNNEYHFQFDFEIYNLSVYHDQTYALGAKGVILINANGTTELIYATENATSFLRTGNCTWVSSLSKGIVKFCNETTDYPLDLIYDSLSIKDFAKNKDGLLFLSNDHIMSVTDYSSVAYRARDTNEKWRCIEIDDDGELWVGRGGSLLAKTSDKFLPKPSIQDIVSFKGMTVVANNEYFETVTIEEEIGIIETVDLFGITTLYNLKDSVLLIGTRSGLFAWNGETIVPVYQDIHGQSIINQTGVIGNDTLLIGTNGMGLFIHFGNDVVNLDRNNGLLSNAVTSLEVRDQRIFVGTDKGLNIIDVGVGLDVFQLASDEGLTNVNITCLAVVDQDIFIGTNGGIYHTSAEMNFLKPNNGQIFLSKVLVDGIEYEDQQVINVSHDVKFLDFVFDLVTLEDKATLKYVLKEQSSKERFEELSHDPNYQIRQPRAGNYSLDVYVKTSNSNWSKPIETSFVVQSPLYQKWWFYVLLTGGSGAILFLVFYQRSKTREKIAILSQRASSAKLAGLRAQINPHFLFNSLNSINNQILHGKTEDANIFLSKMSMLMRSVLDNSGLLYVNLNEEIEQLRLYLEVEHMRLEGRFSFDISIDESIDIYTTQIPAMIVQPFVENAVWHGVAPLDEGGLISIKFESLKDELVVLIQDNGGGFDETQVIHQQSKGQRLVKERLELLNQINGAELTCEINSKQTGTSIIIRIPDRQ